MGKNVCASIVCIYCMLGNIGEERRIGIQAYGCLWCLCLMLHERAYTWVMIDLAWFSNLCWTFAKVLLPWSPLKEIPGTNGIVVSKLCWVCCNLFAPNPSLLKSDLIQGPLQKEEGATAFSIMFTHLHSWPTQFNTESSKTSGFWCQGAWWMSPGYNVNSYQDGRAYAPVTTEPEPMPKMLAGIEMAPRLQEIWLPKVHGFDMFWCLAKRPRYVGPIYPAARIYGRAEAGNPLGEFGQSGKATQAIERLETSACCVRLQTSLDCCCSEIGG